MEGGEPVHLFGQIGFLAGGAHPLLGFHQKYGRFRVLARADVSAGYFKKLPETIGLLYVVGLESFLSTIQFSRAQKNFSVKRAESRVAVGRSERIKKRNGALRISFAKFGVGKKHRGSSVVGRKLVGTAKILKSGIQRSGGLYELSCAKITSRGHIEMLQTFGLLPENGVARRIFGIEHGHTFVTCEGFNALPLLLTDLGCDSKLFNRFGGAVLLLQQSGVTHEAVGRLRVRAKKTHKNGRSFGAVSGFDQAVELNAVILRSEGWFIQPGMNVSEGLQRFLMVGRVFENRLILGDGLAKLILFEV